MHAINLVAGVGMLCVAAIALLGHRHIAARAEARGERAVPALLWITMGMVLLIAGALQLVIAFSMTFVVTDERAEAA
jgi:hypothetical protein